MRIFLSALALLALTACATTPAAYGPATGSTRYGYSETQIEKDRYRVTYRDNTGAPRADDLSLLRAAELTLQNGYDWFVVTQRGLQETGGYGRSGPDVSVGVGGSNYGGHSYGGVGLGIGYTFGGGGSQAASATIEIRMGKGPMPNGADVYDARDVEKNVRPRS
jgi:hypothetical protein